MTARERLSKTAPIVARIEAEQETHPGYANDMLMAIVNAELRRLEMEMLADAV